MHKLIKVMGGADPVSGTTSLMEIVAGFGELLRSGWKPARTIIIGNWDGEEVCESLY
jgi:N-acetylated-alpha-linked acidic dipeptidase